MEAVQKESPCQEAAACILGCVLSTWGYMGCRKRGGGKGCELPKGPVTLDTRVNEDPWM